MQLFIKPIIILIKSRTSLFNPHLTQSHVPYWMQMPNGGIPLHRMWSSQAVFLAVDNLLLRAKPSSLPI